MRPRPPRPVSYTHLDVYKRQVFNPSVACVLRIDLYNGFRVELSEKRSAEPLTVYAIARALTHADKRILLIKRILKPRLVRREKAGDPLSLNLVLRRLYAGSRTRHRRLNIKLEPLRRRVENAPFPCNMRVGFRVAR